ncbi:MAG: HEPN domain-containing protein [Anaerolineales bacterium]|nr:HEPN domain-containing protein [Anaerolineales bacterium]
MDDATKRTYIRVRLDRAYDDLATARDSLTQGHWRGAVNRAYYTIFHVASAALLWLNIERARHSGVHSAFGEFLIKPGKIEPEFSEIYAKARKAREEQDYDLYATPLTGQDAEQILAAAARFVARLESYLRQEGAI